MPRLTELDGMLVGLTPGGGSAKFDLAIISVLLDAGAGHDWRYHEQETGLSSAVRKVWLLLVSRCFVKVLFLGTGCWKSMLRGCKL